MLIDMEVLRTAAKTHDCTTDEFLECAMQVSKKHSFSENFLNFVNFAESLAKENLRREKGKMKAQCENTPRARPERVQKMEVSEEVYVSFAKVMTAWELQHIDTDKEIKIRGGMFPLKPGFTPKTDVLNTFLGGGSMNDHCIVYSRDECKKETEVAGRINEGMAHCVTILRRQKLLPAGGLGTRERFLAALLNFAKDANECIGALESHSPRQVKFDSNRELTAYAKSKQCFTDFASKVENIAKSYRAQTQQQSEVARYTRSWES